MPEIEKDNTADWTEPSLLVKVSCVAFPLASLLGLHSHFNLSSFICAICLGLHTVPSVFHEVALVRKDVSELTWLDQASYMFSLGFILVYEISFFQYYDCGLMHIALIAILYLLMVGCFAYSSISWIYCQKQCAHEVAFFIFHLLVPTSFIFLLFSFKYTPKEIPDVDLEPLVKRLKQAVLKGDKNIETIF